VAYNPATTYTTGNVVSCVTTCSTNGSSYILTGVTAVGADPSTTPSVWLQIAAGGAKGATGATGATGVGLTGAAGATGANGPAGPAGATGSAGAAGATGATGPAGVTGAIGVTGTIGSVTSTNNNSTGSANVSGSSLTINFPSGAPNIQYLSTFTDGNTGNTAIYYAPLTAGVTTGASDTSIAGYASVPTLGATASVTISPVACTITGMYVSGETVLVNTGAAGSTTGTVTLYHNGTATALSCPVSGMSAATNLSKNTCSSTGSIAVAAGDQLSLGLSESNTSTNYNSLFLYSVLLKCY
jgi:hypothetical protein